ncbi:MAG: metal-binding protein [Pyrinomonadaceae bacterium]
MPNARTHDAITFMLAAPAAAAAYAATARISAAVIVGLSFLFGGLMFGPDLDTVSRQYSRWGLLRWLWFPYRSFFKHRSRFSHGLLLGALLRVFYFAGVVTLVAFIMAYLYASFTGGRMPRPTDIATVWRPIGEFVNAHLGGSEFYVLSFVGVWVGAASHTFTDLAGSFLKTGRVAKFL